jgi:hypothetical protein
MTRLHIYKGSEHKHARAEARSLDPRNKEVTQNVYEQKALPYGTGRRKSSSPECICYRAARAKITINGRDIDDYFGLDTLKLIVRQPLNTTGTIDKVEHRRHRFRRRRL